MRTLRQGGAIGARDLYVERAADGRVRQALRGGRLCHVIAASRTGKTSLALRALRILKEDGFRTAYVDVTGPVLAGREGTKHFYQELARQLAEELKFSQAEAEEAEATCTGATGWAALIRRLSAHDTPLALVLDETNSMLVLEEVDRHGFLSTFKMFDADRARSSQRAGVVPGTTKVGICLVGYTNPQTLTTSEGLSPFNTSRAIPLDDFTLDELNRDLGPELKERGAADPAGLLRVVHESSHGHPYITARLIAPALDRHVAKPSEPLRRIIEQVSDEVFGRIRLSDEPVFDHAIKQIKAGGPSQTARRLELYEAILESGGDGVAIDPADPRLATDLQLAGVVAARGEPLRLFVRNPIIASRFDKEWIVQANAQLNRPFAEAARRWIDAGRSEKALLTRADILGEIPRQGWELTATELELLGRSLEREAANARRERTILSALLGGAAVGLLLLAYATQQSRLEMNKLEAQRELELAERVAFEKESAKRLDEMSTKLAAAQEVVTKYQAGDAERQAALAALAKELDETKQFAIKEKLANLRRVVGQVDLPIEVKTRLDRDVDQIGKSWLSLAAERKTCDRELAECTPGQAECLQSLGACTNQRGTCEQNLTSCTTAKATADQSLANCVMLRAACDSSLSTCTVNRERYATDLAACRKLGETPLPSPLHE